MHKRYFSHKYGFRRFQICKLIYIYIYKELKKSFKDLKKNRLFSIHREVKSIIWKAPTD